MKRYLNSFFITLIIYAFVIGSLYYAYTNKKIDLNKKQNTKKVSLNYVSIVEEKSIKKDIKKPKQIVKKTQERKVVKTKTIKTIKPKKTVVKKQSIKKQQIKKEQKEEVKKIATNKKIEQKLSKPKINQEKVYINKNLRKIRTLIQKNIVYSKRAKSFNIQGEVKVRFKILKNGSIKDVEVLKGHKLLRKSTIDAILNASKDFPTVPKSLVITIPITYRLI
ncbi:hypothetical protein CRU98_00435 [Arcobacter sp. CECT 8986]|uniref:energy transducer TonB n=1 Tax=Arcobacter sp. CECT 8986 TaxID=2044507 RepID=UPI001009D5D9|nr:energy transducer TonB [Arcobacter sp. CECT 8986]RXK00951.1 hypothetical protein CRU98_00435 [Arcobacter sp. CECT 8986]